MRRIADLYPGEAKTEAKDAALIADTARAMPHTLRSLELADEIRWKPSATGSCGPGRPAQVPLTS